MNAAHFDAGQSTVPATISESHFWNLSALRCSSSMKVARYIRVSRLDQNPELQADATLDLIQRRGWTLAETYVDQGVSGARTRRPQLTRLLTDARRRRFDMLVVYRSDRLFRSLRDMIATLDDLAAMGVGYVSVSEPFDTSTPSGKLLLHLVSALGEFERALLIERTKAGLQAAVRRGAKLGRPRVQVDLARAAGLRSEGRTFAEIAAELGVGVATLHRALAAETAAPARVTL
jgi:DNA invertase Pin-like site-specific DNA recombinase